MYSYFQVFFPINVTETHWYLVVLNGHKCRVQVLDSMGTATRRPEVEQLVRD
jgi:Ulp1 family protease